jgi:membrane fusion protein, multidrug efflux system
MRVRWWVAALLSVLLLVLLAGVKASQFGAMAKQGKSFTPPPTSVTSAKVEAQDWPVTRTAVGSLVAMRGVTLSSELAGKVRRIQFENGTFVQHGDVLISLDTSTEEAQLQSALADAQLAQQTLTRNKALVSGGAATQADLDAAQARAAQTAAAVTNIRTVIAKKQVRAPFSGRIGIRQVELGQILSPGTPVASLTTVDPIYAEFLLPQQALADLALAQRVQLTLDVFPGHPWEGEVITVNPEVDVANRNVRVRATVPNTDGRLRPGMFADVSVFAGTKAHVLAIPATAVLFAPYGDSVFVLEEKDGKTVAQQRFIRTGEKRGDFVAVTQGLKEGEEIVSGGAFKVRNGATVAVDNADAPGASLTPNPPER